MARQHAHPAVLFRLAAAGATFLTLIISAPAQSSPPACSRDVADLFQSADVVVLAAPLEGKRIRYNDRLGLIAKFQVTERLKGREKAAAIIQLEDHCINRPLPRGMEGYPAARRYCLGGYRPRLPGIDNASGDPLRLASNEHVLFLNSRRGPGAKKIVYEIVPDSGYGGSCLRKRNELTRDEAAAIERVKVLLGRKRLRR